MKDKIRSLDQALMSPAQKRHFLAALRHPTVNASYIADVCCHQDVYVIPWSDNPLHLCRRLSSRCHVRLSEPGTSGFYSVASGIATESSVSVKVIRVRPVAGKSPWGGQAPQIPQNHPFLLGPPLTSIQKFSPWGAMVPLAPPPQRRA